MTAGKSELVGCVPEVTLALHVLPDAKTELHMHRAHIDKNVHAIIRDAS